MPEGVGYASTNVIAGTGLDLNYIQNRVYAYSGTFAASTASATMFNFQTGNKTIRGLFTLNGQIYYDDGTAGGHSVFKISFNGVVIHLTKCDTVGNDSPVQTFQKVVIPPYTNVLVECISSENNANELMTATFTGKTL